MGWVNTAKPAAQGHHLGTLRRGRDASTCNAACFASANREPALMLKELSTTTSSSLPFTPRACPPDKRIGERQHQQQQQCGAQRKEQQVAQPPMAGGALRAPLEEHQGTKRQRRGYVTAQQMNVDRQANRRQAKQEPWTEKSHQRPPWRMARYSRSVVSSGWSVTSRW